MVVEEEPHPGGSSFIDRSYCTRVPERGKPPVPGLGLARAWYPGTRIRTCTRTRTTRVPIQYPGTQGRVPGRGRTRRYPATGSRWLTGTGYYCCNNTECIQYHPRFYMHQAQAQYPASAQGRENFYCLIVGCTVVEHSSPWPDSARREV